MADLSTVGAAVRSRGLVVRGRVWDGNRAHPGVVIIDSSGTVAATGPAGQVEAPPDLPVYGDAQSWVGPGLVDAHVHVAFAKPADIVRHGVVAVRDLGAPLAELAKWRDDPSGPYVTGAGPILTAPRGYPMSSWGAGGFGLGVGHRQRARQVISDLVQGGASLIKVALEPADGQPVLTVGVLRALVDATHDAGLAVTAHALTVAMVELAIDAGVDELAHTPVEPLPVPVIERLAMSRVGVVSTLHALSGYPDSAVRDNAAALVAAGVRLAYGTDLGNAGTRAGAEPREFELLASSGLGMVGAVRAATCIAAGTAGIRDLAGLGRITVGRPAALVVLGSDPLADPEAWRRPHAVVIGSRVRAQNVT